MKPGVCLFCSAHTPPLCEVVHRLSRMNTEVLERELGPCTMGDTARPAASEGCSVQPNPRRLERPHPRTVVAKQGDARMAEGDPLPCKEDGGAESPHRLHVRAVRVPGIQPGPQVPCHHHLGGTWARPHFSVRTQACLLCKARVLQCTIPCTRSSDGTSSGSQGPSGTHPQCCAR